jgi:hypothetical protein
MGLVRSIGPAWLVAVAVLIVPFYIPSAKAADIRVMISGGLFPANLLKRMESIWIIRYLNNCHCPPSHRLSDAARILRPALQARQRQAAMVKLTRASSRSSFR